MKKIFFLLLISNACFSQKKDSSYWQYNRNYNIYEVDKYPDKKLYWIHVRKVGNTLDTIYLNRWLIKRQKRY